MLNKNRGIRLKKQPTTAERRIPLTDPPDLRNPNSKRFTV
jgi:hypothetical protein